MYSIYFFLQIFNSLSILKPNIFKLHAVGLFLEPDTSLSLRRTHRADPAGGLLNSLQMLLSDLTTTTQGLLPQRQRGTKDAPAS